MKMAKRFGRPAWVLAAALLTAIASERLGRADYVYLKDGTILRGEVIREGVTIFDKASQTDHWIAKANGFYLVDDRARKIVFSQRNVSVAHPEFEDDVEKREVYGLKPALKQFPRVAKHFKDVVVRETFAWDPNGGRRIKVTVGGKDFDLTQRITSISPSFIRADVEGHHWPCSMLPGEFDPDTLIGIIRAHLQKNNQLTDLERQLSVMRYCVQVGWFEHAEHELEAIVKKFPDQAAALEGPQKKLRQLKAARWQQDVELAVKAGQHQRAVALLKEVPAGAGEELQRKMRSQRMRYEEKEAALKEARRVLTAVRGQVPPGRNLPASFSRALDAIARELHLDSVDRLESFVRLAQQEERNAKNGRKPAFQPEELLALAVSGWAIGNGNAETDPNLAHAFWYTREFVLEYLRTEPDDRRGRSRLLESYLTARDGNPAPRYVDEIAQIIQYLPPVAAEEKLPAEPAEYQTRIKSTYQVVLPPEYHHQRHYPVLVALPNVQEQEEATVRRYRELAARHGYLLVIPSWCDRVREKYEATAEEQAAVLEALRDARRRFQVDSERVFLAGFDESGRMAYDLGLTHPDLFAGVVVMAGRPDTRLLDNDPQNGQHLPFYVIDGQYNGKNQQQAAAPAPAGEKENRNRAIFRQWVSAGYPSMYVEYTGRGAEFFAGELPMVFDWMARKKRAKGLPELGHGSSPRDLKSLRPEANRFYWISIDPDRGAKPRPASIGGAIAEANVLVVRVHGVSKFRVWLNSSMVDFDQPVIIRPQGGREIKKQVEPDHRVLLEDFYERGDKKNLFVAAIDFG